MVIFIILFSLSILLMFFFSAYETAVISANKLKIEVEKSNETRKTKIISIFFENINILLGTILLGKIISLVAFSISINFFINSYLIYFQWINYVLAIILILFFSLLIVLLLSDYVPKNIFRINPNDFLNKFSYITYFFYILLRPFVILVFSLSTQIIKLITKIKINNFTIENVNLNTVFTKNESNNESAIDESDEVQMFQNALELRTLRLKECMIPRTEIHAIESNKSIEDLREMCIATGHSKILVYEGTIDNVLGYIHAYDLFKKPKSIKEIIKPIIVAPETMSADKLLNTFITKHKSLAIIVDEFGGTEGLITIEDVIEEIFGDIEDEYDKEENSETKISNSEFIFSARLEIAYLNEKYDFDIPESENYETLAGYIIHFYENIPLEKEKIKIDNFNFEILKATETRIEKVKFIVN